MEVPVGLRGLNIAPITLLPYVVSGAVSRDVCVRALG
jgi:hypothetical protein